MYTLFFVIVLVNNKMLCLQCGKDSNSVSGQAGNTYQLDNNIAIILKTRTVSCPVVLLASSMMRYTDRIESFKEITHVFLWVENRLKKANRIKKRPPKKANRSKPITKPFCPKLA